MRPLSQIRQQLKQVTYRHLQRQLRELFKRRPDTCLHNRGVKLNADSSVHLCGVLDSDGTPRCAPCDDRIPGCNEYVHECPLWEPLKSKQQAKAEFYEVLRSDERGVVASKYPDIAALMWVLDDPGETPSEQEVEASLDEDEPELESPWTWRGMWMKLGGGR